MDANTRLPVAFAAIFSKSLEVGVYSNEDGFFMIRSQKSLENETLIISCVGYKPKTFKITGPDCGWIKLVPIAYNLKEVEITGNEAEEKTFKYLDSLFQKYRNYSIKIDSKGYFSFTAEEDTLPLEFQEMYYNVASSCRDGLEQMLVKTGRVGNNKQNFLTLNVSDIFLNLKLFSLNGNINIPHSPTNFRYKNMKKFFHFTTVGVTPEEDKYFMVLEPRTKKNPYFSVSLSIDKTKNAIEKIEYSLKANYFSYFYPMMPNDTVRNIELKLSYVFDDQNPYQIQQAGILYRITYYSCSTSRDHLITGSGKIILFDFGKSFPSILPSDLFKDQNNDYRLVSSLPYDSLFWSIPGISPLSTKNLKFLDFFNVKKLLTTFNVKVLEVSLSKYMPWKKSHGVVYKDFDSIYQKQHKTNSKIHDVYNLQKCSIKTKIVLNYFYLGDSLHLTSHTLIDLVDSYFEPDTGYNMIAYINLNFDLAEVYRRKIIEQIYHDKKFQKAENEPELKNLYNQLNTQLNDTLNLLKKQTQESANTEMLLTWLKLMKENYKIDRKDLYDFVYYEDRRSKGKAIKIMKDEKQK